MNRLTAFRVFCGAALCLGAIGLGSAFHLPAMADAKYQQFVTPQVSATCASSSPCLQETNSQTGAGVKGISTSGNGSMGQTKFKSTSSSNAKAGVFGQDLSSSGGFDSGVLGSSTNGIGVQGTSVNGSGVVALSTNQSALFAENTGFSDGIQSVALNNDGANSSTQNPSATFGRGRSGVYGHDDSSDGGRLNVGVAGSSTNGVGVSASSTNWIGIVAVGGGTDGTFDYPALSVTANVLDNTPTNALIVCTGHSPCSDGNYVARINGYGDMTLIGKLYTAGFCSTGCARQPGAPGRRVVSYASTDAQPTLQDVGEAQLISGRAYVHFEAQYASVVDRSSRYFVFITPEGDCNQLYVTDKTSSGFSVREAHGGLSTVPFQYRIVARPYGDKSTRLPSIEMRAMPARAAVPNVGH
jgi:hypothetical protein